MNSWMLVPENGTYFKGAKIAANTPYPLANGDEIVIGSTRLLFNCETPAGTDIPAPNGAAFLVDDNCPVPADGK